MRSGYLLAFAALAMAASCAGDRAPTRSEVRTAWEQSLECLGEAADSVRATYEGGGDFSFSVVSRDKEEGASLSAMAADCFERNFAPVGMRIQRHFGGTEEEAAESRRRLGQCLGRLPSTREDGAVGHHVRELCFELAADYLRDRVERRIPDR